MCLTPSRRNLRSTAAEPSRSRRIPDEVDSGAKSVLMPLKHCPALLAAVLDHLVRNAMRNGQLKDGSGRAMFVRLWLVDTHFAASVPFAGEKRLRATLSAR